MSTTDRHHRDHASIDDLMDRASEALVRCDYFEAESLAADGLARARDTRDYERMARITLPLLESRRQKMQLAQDAGRVAMLSATEAQVGVSAPGLYLAQPPLVAADAREARRNADRRRIPVVILTREPMSRAAGRSGLWPVVAVGVSLTGKDLSVRTYLPPPPGVVPSDVGITRDQVRDEIGVGWFVTACEALGDAAIARLNPADPAAHRVDDVLEFLSAWPTHEKLHQRLIDECRSAMAEPPPSFERRRGVNENPWSF